MTNPPLIYDLEQSELKTLLAQLDEPSYRVDQVWQGLYQQFWNKPDELTNLPKTLREQLGGVLRFEVLTPVKYLDSSDGQTRKTLFQLHDGHLIEAVLMKYGDPADSPIAGVPSG